MRDFTYDKYCQLLRALQLQDYQFVSAVDCCASSVSGRFVAVRHDVDRTPAMALRMAHIEESVGVKSSYFFRSRHISSAADTIRQIAAMGHEIGYHYEDLVLACGDVELAVGLFSSHLAALRRLASVAAIAMHGSPLSRHDSMQMWNHADYRTMGVVGDMMRDVDFDQVYYITDTGRRWDGVALRDVSPSASRWQQLGHRYHSTDDIIQAINSGYFPSKVMITIHPERWTDTVWQWLKQLVWQNIKNFFKRIIKWIRNSI